MLCSRAPWQAFPAREMASEETWPRQGKPAALSGRARRSCQAIGTKLGRFAAPCVAWSALQLRGGTMRRSVLASPVITAAVAVRAVSAAALSAAAASQAAIPGGAPSQTLLL